MSTRSLARCAFFALPSSFCAVLALGACRHDPGTTIIAQGKPGASVPETSDTPPPTDWRGRGATAGTISPRQASCLAHCKHELDKVQPVPASAQANTFGQSCIGSCLAQVSEEKGMQCYAVFGAAASSEWQALYLARGMVEAVLPCTTETADGRPEALRMRALFEVEQRSPETLAAVAAERRALLSGTPDDMQSAVVARRQANESSAWQEVMQAFHAWQAGGSQGERMLACFERRNAVCAIALGAE